MNRLYLTVSGSGHELTIGHPRTKEDATRLVKRLDHRWETHDKYSLPLPKEPDPLSGYEGCDIYLDLDGITYYLGDNERWEHLDVD
jgi:hypothetical protein